MVVCGTLDNMEHVTHCDQCDSTTEIYLKIHKRKSRKERAKEVAVCGTLENAIMELTGRRRPPTGPLLALPPSPPDQCSTVDFEWYSKLQN